MEEQLFDTQRIGRTWLSLTLPVVLGMLVSLAYNLADTWFIARTGDTCLVAGVSLCSPVFTALMAFGNIYGQGGSSVISRLLGAGREEEVKKVSAFCFYLAIVTGVLLSILMLALQGPLLRLLGTSDETFSHARDYYRILALGAPLIVLNFIHMNLLRCEGMSRQSMYGTVLGSVVNIVLDPVMIFSMGMGAAGAALATVIGYLASDAFLLGVVLRRSRVLSVSLRLGMPAGEQVRQIFSIGITAALANLMSSAASILLNRYLLPYGSGSIAAMGIAVKVNMIPQLLLVGFAFGGVPFFGYLCGAGDQKNLARLIRFAGGFLAGMALALTLVLLLGAEGLIRAFLDSGDVVKEGALMLRLTTAGNVFAAITLLTTVLFQASGKAVPAFLMSVSRQGVVYFLTLAVGSALFGYLGVLSAQAAADLLSAVLGVILCRGVLFHREK